MAQNTQKVGWIGMGRMGYAMAERVAKAGYDLTVWNRTRAKAEPLAQHEVHEVGGAVGRERVRERQHDHVVHGTLGQHLTLLDANGQQRRRRGGIHDFERVRLERDQHRGEVQGARARRQPLEHETVPAMHAVERAHGAHGAARSGRQAK